jgi:23S rRNA (cytidine2498-2'-O)-methyltransferase
VQLPRFLYITCQVGAETAVKHELARDWPDFRFAYSRPGFLTFKLPEQHGLAADFDLGAVFARSYGFSLGEAKAGTAQQLADQVWQLCGDRAVRRIHVWPRDVRAAGDHGYEPGLTAESLAARDLLLQCSPHPNNLAKFAKAPDAPAQPGDPVLDCILIDPLHWWVGYHEASSFATRWPGGMVPLQLPAEAVSRAWLKMEEALRWADLPIPPDARIAELGSAPGGASQALLARQWNVLGIDPAQMDPRVLGQARFTHLRRRANQVRRREYRKIRWLTADMNVAPQFTLDVVESIVTHPEVNVRGMILTLKLIEWELAGELPKCLGRIRSWGFNLVRARQLVHNRQEVCVVALQKPFRRKPPVHHDQE